MHWVVHFDARGKHNLRYRCKNVNLVEKTVKGVEDELEFLFVPCVLRCAAFALFVAPCELTCLPLQLLCFPGDFC